MKRNSPPISRRKVLFAALQGAGLFLLSGCDGVFNRLQQNKKVLSLLESAEGANRFLLRLVSGKDKLAQEFREEDISRYFKANGNPPPMNMDYVLNAMLGWPAWRLEVGGLVRQPAQWSLEEIKSLPARVQITRHDCVEGWSAIAKWKGVPLAEIMKRVEPSPEARFAVFYCMDVDRDGNHYYESIDVDDAAHPQTILAYEMNGEPLPVDHGAPLRLRVETQLGYKMAKYLHRVEFVAELEKIGQGRGGYWEDLGYEWYAGI
jgi:DMSO/TMAO reductase YedYZ molybdopterin-dependent catalytic subunit